VVRFFDENQRWLTDVLTDGQTDRTLSFSGRVEDAAQNILSTLEGAMLVARPYGDLARFDAARRQLLAGLEPAQRPSGRRPRTA
jgi:TetR/AcrR family transcriptional regulator, transcriptional repressor for nem operon